MFNTRDHFVGAITVRIHRRYCHLQNEPDISFIKSDLGIGGVNSCKILSKEKINAILDLRMEAELDFKELEKYSLEYLRIKIPDGGILKIDEANQALKWIDDNLKNRKKVFVHCNLGRGRGPMIACLYLIFCGMEKQKAIKKIKKIRKYSYFNQKQLKFINEFKVRL